MVELRTKAECPACGSTLLDAGGSEGLCPGCLLELALESPSLLAELEGADDEETLAYSREAYSSGQILGNRYRIRSLLGRGGMGEIWRATDLKLRVDVALKALRPQLLADTRALETLRQEVRVAREVVSPNVCRVFDLVELDGQELVSMEYIDGVTLLDILKMRAPLELAEAREIASQFLAGLEAIHEADLVHRDVKPENLMMTRSGRVVLMDFGIAKGLAEGKTGTISGTPAYMSPEQSRGEQLDARADVYSAGVVLAEMIAPSGLKTFEARQRIWQGIHHEPPEMPESPWAPVLKMAVAGQRERRHASASALARALEEVTLRVAGAEDIKPYPGLASFTEEDAEYFFGRELEVEEMWKKLHRPHLLGLIGASGAGKSSFLRGGLLPVIPTGWRAVVLTPGSHPFSALARALVPELTGDTEALQLLTSPDHADAVLDAVTRWRQQHDEALLIIDQFEELFTQNPPEVQERFAELLGRLALEADVHVLLSMRDDFLAYCSHQESLNPIFSELTPLKPLSGAAIRRALLQPALKCGYRFEDDSLVDEMVEEVSGERGALPLLAFAASRLWDHRDRDQGLLTREAYEHIGGVGGALAQHAEQTLERIGQDQIPIVRELFRNLVTAQGTRAARDRQQLLSVFDGREEESKRPASVPAGEGGTTGERHAAATVLDTLIDARLLTSYEVPAADEGEPPHQRIEIIHESLLSNWPRLVRWQTQDADSAQLRDQIRQVAQMWEERGRPEDLLWTGTSFGEYRLWRERYEGGLSTAEEDFGDAMVHRAERQKRLRRVAISAAFGVLLAVLGVIAYFGWQAELERRRAEAETLRAEAGKLIALGELEMASYPTAALAWATKSLELADTLEARLLALRVLQQGPPATVLDEVSRSEAFSPNGEWLAMGYRGQAWLRSQNGSEPNAIGTFEHEDNQVNLAFAGDNVLVTEQDGDLRGWSVPAGEKLWSSDGERGRLRTPLARGDGYFSFSAEGGQISFHWSPFGEGASRLVGSIDSPSSFDIDPSGSWLAYSRERVLHLRSLENWSRPPLRLGEHTDSIRDLAFHPSGERIAAVDETGEIRFWTTTGSAVEALRTMQATRLVGLRYDPTGRWLAGSRVEQGLATAWLWDLMAPQGTDPLTLRRTDDATVDVPMFHPTRPWLFVPGGGGFSVWSFAHPYPWILRGHKGWVWTVAFGPDGDWLITADGFGVRAWPLEAQDHGASRILLQKDLGYFPQVDVDPVGRRLAVAARDKTISVVPLEGGPTRELTAWGPLSKVGRIRVAFSPDGRLLAAVPNSGPATEMLVRVWDLGSGEVRTLGRVEGETSYLDFVDDRRLVWSGNSFFTEGRGGGERVFDLETGSVEVVAEGGSEGSRTVSRDGSFIITTEYRAGEEGEKADLVWRSLATGESRRITSHGDTAFSVALDPSDRWVVTGDSQGLVRIGPVSGEEPHLLYGHQGPVGTVAISSDGRWIASGGNDRTVWLWPIPDMSKLPFHTRPLDELLATLHSLTNLRVVEDPESSTGWQVEVGPFPGWKEVPEW